MLVVLKVLSRCRDVSSIVSGDRGFALGLQQSSEGDSVPRWSSLLVAGRGAAHRRAQGRENKSSRLRVVGRDRNGRGATEDLTWSYRSLQGLLKYITANEMRKVNIV